MTTSYPLPDDWFDPGEQSVESFADKIVTPINDLYAQTAMKAAGVTSINPSALNTPTFADVTFPPNLFTTTPAVQVTAQAINPQAFAVSYSSPTTTGVRLWLSRLSGATGTPVNVAWFAEAV